MWCAPAVSSEAARAAQPAAAVGWRVTSANTSARVQQICPGMLFAQSLDATCRISKSHLRHFGGLRFQLGGPRGKLQARRQRRCRVRSLIKSLVQLEEGPLCSLSPARKTGSSETGAAGPEQLCLRATSVHHFALAGTAKAEDPDGGSQRQPNSGTRLMVQVKCQFTWS